MKPVQGILDAFNRESSNNDNTFLIYDPGKDLSSVIKLSFKNVHLISQVIYKDIIKCSPQKGEIIGLYFNAHTSAILGIIPAIIAVLRSNCAFLVFDRQAQPWSWIEEVIFSLNIRNILTNDGKNLAKELETNFKSKYLKCLQVTQITTTQERLGVTLSRVEIFMCPKSSVPKIEYIEMVPDLLYVVQSSGTTKDSGKENNKLIFVPGTSIISNVYDFQKEFQLPKCSVLFTASPPTFDPFYLDLILAFYTHSTVLLVSQSSKSQSDKLFEIIKRQQVNFMQITPSLYKNLDRNLEMMLTSKENPLKSLIIGGEKFPLIPAKVLSQTRTSIYNIYGVSEMSCWQTCLKVNGGISDQDKIFDRNKKAIISETEIEICEFKEIMDDDTLVNRQDGARYGEIVISSKTRQCKQLVCREWLKNEDIYRVRTGDYGYEYNNCVFICNRIQNHKNSRKLVDSVGDEHHFKINGKRVHLSQIENALEKLIQQRCMCLLTYVKNEDFKRITAFVLDPEIKDDEKDVRVKLKQKEHDLLKMCLLNLPSHYVPQKFIFISKIPMTLNGKIDKKVLLHKLSLQAEKEPHVAKNELSKEEIMIVLGQIWYKYTPSMQNYSTNDGLLKRPSLLSQFVSDGGGDSILAILFQEEVENVFGQGIYRLPIEIILNQTYGDILEWIMSKIKEQVQLPTVAKFRHTTTTYHNVDDEGQRKKFKLTHYTDSSHKLDFKDGIYVATKGILLNSKPRDGSVANPCTEVKGDVAKLSLSQAWNVDLLKCVDASPVVVDRNLSYLPISEDHCSVSKYENVETNNTTVYIGSHSGLFVAVNVKNGTIKWKQRLGGKFKLRVYWI